MSNTLPIVAKDEDALRNVKSYEDALALLQDKGVAVHTTTEFGDGFEVCKNKDSLVGVEFIVMDSKFTPGDYGDDFVILHIVTRDGRKLILVDGGTGICLQMRQYHKWGKEQGLKVPAGLIRSDFRFIEGVGVVRPGEDGYESATPGTTYYLS